MDFFGRKKKDDSDDFRKPREIEKKFPKKKKEKKKKKKKDKRDESPERNSKRKRRDSDISGSNSSGDEQPRRSDRKTKKTIRLSEIEQTAKKGNSAARKKAIRPCTLDPGDIPEELKIAAKKYALIRTSSKKKFEWEKELPEVHPEDRPLVRRWSKKHLLPEVVMVKKKDREGDTIFCPIFPEDTVIATVDLPKDLWDETDNDQFKWLDQYVVDELSDEIPDFDAEERMSGGKKYTWHHHHDTGKMQLVENGIHSMTPHSGGREIWCKSRRDF